MMDANALGTRLTEAFSDSTPWAARSAKRLYVSIEPAMARGPVRPRVSTRVAERCRELNM